MSYVAGKRLELESVINSRDVGGMVVGYSPYASELADKAGRAFALHTI